MTIVVVGAGLAGVECANILSMRYNLQVTLIDMKPQKKTEAHHNVDLFAELVCSNSLKSKSLLHPIGVLKEELRELQSLCLEVAHLTAVNAGETLAVDRLLFAERITAKIKANHLITVVCAEINVIEDIYNFVAKSLIKAIVIATGPLTSESLVSSLAKITEQSEFYFYDAIAPIISADNIDYNIVFKQNRQTFTKKFATTHHEKYEKLINETNEVDDKGDYLNIPLNKEEYLNFVNELILAQKVPYRNFEKPKFFSACQPIEVLAETNVKTLAFGPMKPKGIVDPQTNRMPYAVIQLRQENLNSTAYNIVGFQTRLTWPEQKRIFTTLPGLNKVEFLRFGSMHRNSYFIPQKTLEYNENLFKLKNSENIYLVGQITGVEGYVESMGIGLFVGHLLGKKFSQQVKIENLPINSALGAIINYLFNTTEKYFSPVNCNLSLFKDVSPEDIIENGSCELLNLKKLDKGHKRLIIAERARKDFLSWKERNLKSM